MPRLTAAKLDNLSPDALQAFKRDAKVAVRAAAAGPYIVAEGDSWFDYPIGTDIIDCLRHFHGYEVSNYAKAGDTIENMAYGTRFSPMHGYRPLPNDVQSILADIADNRPAAFIISGGGNDIAGDEFGQFLNHASSGKAPFRADFADYMVNTVFRTAYSDLIDQVTAARRGITVVAHGYGYPIPDGRGVGFGVGISFIGPWLRPALAAKRIPAMTDGVEIIDTLIDMFNAMIASLEADHPNFHYVDARGIIGRDPAAWANELHVRNSVYKKIADAIDAAITSAGSPVTPSALARAKPRNRRKPASPRTRRRR